MSVDKDLLNNVMSLTQKKAYAPPAPAAPPMDPSMMGGMPPMDPSMMGGMPPMDPSMMGGMPPMDPSMMGGMPPMDPSMMGGMPPMDPSMMGGAPPLDPSMVGALGQGGEGMPPMDPAAPPAGGGETVQVSLEDLRTLFSELAATKPEEEEKTGRVTNRDLDSRIDGLESMMGSLMNALGVSMPPELMAPVGEEAPEEEPPAPEEAIPGGELAMPEAAVQSSGQEAGNPLDQLPPGVPKIASESFSSLIKQAGAEDEMLMGILKQLNNYK